MMFVVFMLVLMYIVIILYFRLWWCRLCMMVVVWIVLVVLSGWFSVIVLFIGLIFDGLRLRLCIIVSDCVVNVLFSLI